MNRFALVAIVTLVAVGCARKPRYDWGSYSDSVHALYNDPGEYVLDEDLQRLAIELESAPRERIPPGKAAHIGMLYSTKGDFANAKHYFELEKLLYVESTVMMNRLIAEVSKRNR